MSATTILLGVTCFCIYKIIFGPWTLFTGILYWLIGFASITVYNILFGFHYKVRKVSEATADLHIVLLERIPTSINDIKAAISISLGLDLEQDTFDVIQNGATVLEGDHTIPKSGEVLEVLVHPKERPVSFRDRTWQEDMFEGLMADGSRVRMSCGHAACPENLYRYCMTSLKDNISLKCIKCSNVWDLSEINKKACLSKDECAFISRKMTHIYIENSSDIFQCPDCRNYCTRINQNCPKVTCLGCQKSGRSAECKCWYCNEKWTDGHKCKKQQLQDILSNCERTAMEYSGIVDVPKIRACPKCQKFIEHDTGCKTMTCPFCTHVFCFSCLKSAIGYQLPCGDYDSLCNVAPIQIIDNR